MVNKNIYTKPDKKENVKNYSGSNNLGTEIYILQTDSMRSQDSAESTIREYWKKGFPDANGFPVIVKGKTWYIVYIFTSENKNEIIEKRKVAKHLFKSETIIRSYSAEKMEHTFF